MLKLEKLIKTVLQGNNDFLAFLGHLLTKFGLKVTEKGFFLTLRVKINPNDDGEGMRRDVFLTNGNISNTAYVKAKTNSKLDLSLELNKICEFLDIPGKCLDGVTRLSVEEAFEAIVQSRIFFYDAKRKSESAYDGKYKVSLCNFYFHADHRRKMCKICFQTRESKKGRAMIDQMFELLDVYDGKFEKSRNCDDEIREMFQDFNEGKIPRNSLEV